MLLLLTVALRKGSKMSFLKGGVEEIPCSAPHVQSCQDSHVMYQALAMYIPNSKHLPCIFRFGSRQKVCVSILLLRCLVLLSLLTELAV